MEVNSTTKDEMESDESINLAYHNTKSREYEVAKGMLTGSTPDVGEARHVSGSELADGR
jgi:hypothetical protein